MINAGAKGNFIQHLKELFIMWMGKRSFELYIVHRIILVFFLRHGNNMQYWCLAFITTCLLAELFFEVNFLITKRLGFLMEAENNGKTGDTWR